MTLYKHGDVVLIPFPFTNLSTTKQRPALVISSNWYNQTSGDVILVAITSHIPPRLTEDEYLLSPAEQKEAGLPKTSLIKTGKIITLDQRLIRKSLGNLSAKSMSQITKYLKKVFGP
jgi:mRNA interferase MazF